MRAQLELMIAGDPRIRLLDRVPREQLRGLYAERATSSSRRRSGSAGRTRCSRRSSRTARCSRRPVGGHVGMVEPRRNGWLAADTERRRPDSTAMEADHRLARDEPVAHERVRGNRGAASSGSPIPSRSASAYLELAATPAARRVPRRAPRPGARRWSRSSSPTPDGGASSRRRWRRSPPRPIPGSRRSSSTTARCASEDAILDELAEPLSDLGRHPAQLRASARRATSASRSAAAATCCRSTPTT